MSSTLENPVLSQRERELSAIIRAYSDVTEQLKESHERLQDEVHKLRVELEDKNRELSRNERLAALGQMATGVAHEIRNPLGSMQLYASLLDRDLMELPKAQQLVRKISAGVNALDGIVGDILDFAGRHEPQACQVSLSSLLDSVREAAAAKAQAKRVEWRVNTSVLQQEVWVDPQQMQRAILNVVLNAIDASPEGGTIYFDAHESDGNMAALVISDEGPGIGTEILDRIFNPFFTTKETGTGLGLAIVHRIMESHGGRVCATNREEGGAQFTLYLPTDCENFRRLRRA